MNKKVTNCRHSPLTFFFFVVVSLDATATAEHQGRNFQVSLAPRQKIISTRLCRHESVKAIKENTAKAKPLLFVLLEWLVIDFLVAAEKPGL